MLRLRNLNTIKLNFNDNGSIDIYELEIRAIPFYTEDKYNLVKTVHSLRELNKELKKYDPLR